MAETMGRWSATGFMLALVLTALATAALAPGASAHNCLSNWYNDDVWVQDCGECLPGQEGTHYEWFYTPEAKVPYCFHGPQGTEAAVEAPSAAPPEPPQTRGGSALVGAMLLLLVALVVGTRRPSVPALG
jgi:hypothetical protein